MGRIIIKTLFHLAMTCLTGGIWFIGLVIFHIIRPR